MFNHQPRNIGGMAAITPSVKYLLILNTAVFILDFISSPDPRFRLLTNLFALHPTWWMHWEVGQLFTYMFIHGSTSHLIANMLGLFFIGPAVERTVGSFRFFILYYISGILGGLGWSLLAEPMGPPCVGASGAVMGVIGAFAALYPRAQLLLWFIIPIRAWVLAVILAIWELHETIQPAIGGIANAAHLVGGIAGVSYALALKHPHVINEIKSKFRMSQPSRKHRHRQTPSANNMLSKEEIDRILDKIGKEGMGALTPRERDLLKRATRG